MYLQIGLLPATAADSDSSTSADAAPGWLDGYIRRSSIKELKS